MVSQLLVAMNNEISQPKPKTLALAEKTITDRENKLKQKMAEKEEKAAKSGGSKNRKSEKSNNNKRKKENDSEIETINVKKATKKSSKLCNSCEHDYYDDDYCY